MFNPLGSMKDFNEMTRAATQEFWAYYKKLGEASGIDFRPSPGDIKVVREGRRVTVSGKLPAAIAAGNRSMLEAGMILGERHVFSAHAAENPGLAERAASFQEFVDAMIADDPSFMARAMREKADIDYLAWFCVEPDDLGNIGVRNGFGVDSPLMLESETEGLLPFPEWKREWLRKEKTNAEVRR